MAYDFHTSQVWKSVLSRESSATDQKKSRILEATIDLISTNGIESVTFEAIGKKLKTTKANIKYHFEKKEDLIFIAARLVVMNAQAITSDLVEKARTSDEKLEAVVQGAYHHFAKFPEQIRVWLLFMHYSSLDSQYYKFFSETRAAGRARISFLLGTLPIGNSGSEPDYNKLAGLIQNIITGQLIGLIEQRNSHRASCTDTSKMISTLLIFHGIQWKR